MSSATRLVLFGAVLAVLFSAAAAAGGALDPDAAVPEPAEPMAGAAHGGGEPEGGAAHAGPTKVHGLAVSDAGLRLDVRTPELRRGRAQELAFRVLDEQGEPVRPRAGRRPAWSRCRRGRSRRTRGRSPRRGA